jgi:cephalosporin hydroxylase
MATEAKALMAIDITKALNIYGWMSDAELTWLAEQAREHLCILEIGSYMGRSTRALGDNTLGKVFALDDWLGADSDHRPVSAERSQQLEAEFRHAVEDLIDAGIVIAWRCDSHAPRVKVRPDMVFIDADHSYEGVKRDIETWYPLLQPGGLICGHDSCHEPIMRAVRELLPNHLLARGTTIWYYQKSKGDEK